MAWAIGYRLRVAGSPEYLSLRRVDEVVTRPRHLFAAFVMAALAAALTVAGCHSHGGGTPKPDAGRDGAACSGDGGAHKSNGAACACAADCASGFCVDGLCCNSACGETCKSCNTPAAPGVCSFVPAGGTPSSADSCPQSSVSTCGLDGKCDGKGSCRSYEAGTVCLTGSCDGAAIGGVRVCDGNGSCTSGASIVCAPFNCDSKTNSCVETCAADADCAGNVKCVAGSCGLKPPGALCTASAQCASSFCADGVCCNTACSGPCVSCNQSGRIGTCGPTPRGALDPHKVCATTDKSTCGQTGSCDGVGGCAKYAAETVCVPPTCSGNRVNTAGTCNGLGTCRMPGVQECGTYQCSGGACINHCAGDNDCVDGHSCVNGSCGPKSNGQPCSAGSECASTYCVDGVCCNSSCGAACHSCALSTSLGTCAPSPAAASDPHGMCSDHGPGACGTDGTCDGAGSCHKYPVGTTCAAESCSAGIYTPSSACDANGNCAAPDAIVCAPYVCDGTTRCFQACTANSSCSTGNVCTNSSCGKKPIGAFCGADMECGSGNCEQGVCCTTACTGTCQSCAIPGSMGMCTAVASGPDPASTCVDHGAPGCGTDGKCLAGSCEKYQQGIACAGATCPGSGTTFTPGSTCDGAGTCVTPASTSCSPFACGTNACKATCAIDADCAPGRFCNSGSCGLKSNGAVCSGGPECASGICAQGVCCATSCTGTCMSCALSSTGAAGICTPVAAGGTDPAGHCSDQGTASCGQTGFCDGNGSCALYPASTQCAGPTCPSGSVTSSLARSCDGNGTCKAAATQSCAPFACNAATGTTCVAVCASNADCAPNKFCNAGACGLKRLGQLCAAGSECDSGNCVDGVCCSSASCGNCQVCNLGGSPGSCQPVAAGNMEPHGGCAASNPPCGNNGTCDGNGQCANAAVGITCGTATCTDSTDILPVGACDGNGTCLQQSMNCGAYVCGSGACLTMCGGTSDCIPGDICQSGSCTSPLPLGAHCAAGADCGSGHCTDGVCCSSGPCGSCKSCAVVAGGNCTPTAAGPDPAGVCADQGSGSCGTTGLCDGSGNCAHYPVGSGCAAAGCTGQTLLGASTCNALGNCTPLSMTDCTPYACGGGACNTGCAQSSDCATGYICTSNPDGGPGACTPSP
jgi:hypothetical protein